MLSNLRSNKNTLEVSITLAANKQNEAKRSVGLMKHFLFPLAEFPMSKLLLQRWSFQFTGIMRK